jgi:hypothetical protein
VTVRRANARRVHLARDGLGLTVCGLVAASLGTKGVWRPSWAMTPPAWRCARCRRAMASWQASRPRAPLAWTGWQDQQDEG